MSAFRYFGFMEDEAPGARSDDPIQQGKKMLKKHQKENRWLPHDLRMMERMGESRFLWDQKKRASIAFIEKLAQRVVSTSHLRCNQGSAITREGGAGCSS